MRLPIQIRRAECDALVCGDYRRGSLLHDTVYHVITFYTNLNIIIYN